MELFEKGRLEQFHDMVSRSEYEKCRKYGDAMFNLYGANQQLTCLREKWHITEDVDLFSRYYLYQQIVDTGLITFNTSGYNIPQITQVRKKKVLTKKKVGISEVMGESLLDHEHDYALDHRFYVPQDKPGKGGKKEVLLTFQSLMFQSPGKTL